MPIIFTKDTLRSSVEAATGGQVTVLYDDMGYPSYMVRIPKFNLEDIDPVYGSGAHPAFKTGGIEKSEIFIGAYQSKIYDGRACSLPNVDPEAYINYDNAKAACNAKGAGWHLMTNWEWAAIALWCIRNNFQPRGNTNYGRSHEATYETGRRQDGGTPGNTAGTARTLTGSGPAAWRHNYEFAGIADLVGNIWEWTGGLKLIDGKIYMPSDNNFNMPEEDWPDTNVRFDSSASGDESSSGDIGDPIISDVVTAYAGPVGNDANNYGYTYIANWEDLTKKVDYTIPLPMLQAAIAPIVLAGGTYSMNPKGALYVRNYGTRIPLRGGRWDYGSDAGLCALNLYYSRSYSSHSVGFRVAFVG